MNRNHIAALAMAIASASTSISAAATMVPSIHGTVYFDQNVNGQPNPGEGLAGVALKLYQDDGDGIFNPAVDSLGPSINTGADGTYEFGSLSYTAGYFVERPAQSVGSTQLELATSGLLKPGAPKLTVDDFLSNQTTKANPATPIATSTLDDPLSNVLGKERDLYVRLVSGVGNVQFRSNAYGINILQFDNASGVVGEGVVTWDGKDASANPLPSLGLGDIDLTQGGAATGFLLNLGVDAAGAGEKVKLRLFNDSKTEFSEMQLDLPVTGGLASQWVYAPFSNLVGPVSPSKVNAIQLHLGMGAKSIDAQVGFLGTIGPVKQDFVAVPEPGSMALAALGFCGLLASRRRRRR